MKPQLLVELGTHAGVSYSALCQAVARCGLETRCYAVDTWRADPQAGLYGEEVFEEFRRYHDERYRAFSTLLRTTFDEALAQFHDGTVDLLHIDGYHTYEAVRHDFESWKPKLSQCAVVLFHDTNERQGDFGVWRLWAELSEQFPHFEFLHGHGLGVLAPGKNVNPALLGLCRLSEPTLVAAIRNRFETLGERWLGEAAQHEAQASVKAWEARALESERAREQSERESERARAQIAQRMAAARRDVYDANLRREQAEAEARKAEVEAREALRARDAVLFSTAWQITWPLRAAGQRLPAPLRRTLRRAAKLVWWTLTFKLLRKLRERREALRGQPFPAVAPAEPAQPGEGHRSENAPAGGSLGSPANAPMRCQGFSMPTKQAPTRSPGST
jgi:hypothetical protein